MEGWKNSLHPATWSTPCLHCCCYYMPSSLLYHHNSTTKWDHHLHPPDLWDYSCWWPQQRLLWFVSTFPTSAFFIGGLFLAGGFLFDSSSSSSLSRKKALLGLFVVIIIIATIIRISHWLLIFPILLWFLFRRIRALRRGVFIRWLLLFFWGFFSIYLSVYHGIYHHILGICHSCSN